MGLVHHLYWCSKSLDYNGHLGWEYKKQMQEILNTYAYMYFFNQRTQKYNYYHLVVKENLIKDPRIMSIMVFSASPLLTLKLVTTNKLHFFNIEPSCPPIQAGFA